MNPADRPKRLPGTRVGLPHPSLGLLLLSLQLLAGVPSFAQDVAPQQEPAQEVTPQPEPAPPTRAEASESPPAEAAEEPEEPGPEKPEPEILLPRPGVENLVIYSSGAADQHLDQAVSMTTFNPEELKSLRIQNIEDLADYTPSLEINTRTAASNPTLFIRGIGLKDYNANAAGAVAIYQDGININAPAIQLLQLFDTQDVEVRRGPQGGSGGRGATAGAIYINSALPTNEFDMSASVSAGNFEALDVEGMVNLPVVEDLLSARFAFTFNEREGTIENACADWNPEAFGLFAEAPGPAGTVNSFLVTPDTLRAEYEKDLAADNLPNTEVYQLENTQRQTRQRRLDLAGVNAQAKRLMTDDVCILKSPGRIVTPTGSTTPGGRFEGVPAGTFLAFNVPSLSSFQGLDRDVGDIDNWATRGILRWTPTDDIEWIWNVHNFRSTGDSGRFSMIGADAFPERVGFESALEDGFSEASVAAQLGLEGTESAPGVEPNLTGEPALRGDDPFIGYYNRDGTESLEAYGTSLKGVWDLGDAAITSLSGFETYKRNTEDEGDANPLDIFPAILKDEAYQLSQELRATGSLSALTWSLGAFFLYERLNADNLFPDTRQFEIRQQISQNLLSFAPYLSGAYDLSEDWALEAGTRLNVERKEFTLAATSIATSSGGSNPEIGKQTVEDTWIEPTGELKLIHRPDWSWLDAALIDGLNLYLKGARGFKAGHFNGSQSIQQDVTEKTQVVVTEPEFIWSVEAGIKSRLFDDRMTLTAAGFRYWYTDIQVFDIRNEVGELPTQQLINGDARVWGAEVEVDVRPFEYPVLDGLRLRGGFSYLDTKFTNFEVNKFTGLPKGGGERESTTFGYGGNPLIAAPRRSLYGIIDWELPLFGYGSLTPQWDFNYRSKTYLDPQAVDPISQPSLWLHNASLTYRTEGGRIEVSAWIDNLTNEFYKDDAFDVAREFSTILEVYNDPRTYGLTLTVGW